jgi:cytochrome bd-type quinol oxidase subunit 1
MASIPVASFLAGSLLTLLLPLGMFLALTGWYLWFVKRVPETVDKREPVEAARADAAASKVDL